MYDSLICQRRPERPRHRSQLPCEISALAFVSQVSGTASTPVGISVTCFDNQQVALNSTGHFVGDRTKQEASGGLHPFRSDNEKIGLFVLNDLDQHGSWFTDLCLTGNRFEPVGLRRRDCLLYVTFGS